MGPSMRDAGERAAKMPIDIPDVASISAFVVDYCRGLGFLVD